MSRSAKASPEAITKFKAKAKKGKKQIIKDHSGTVIKIGDEVESVLLKGPKKTGVVRLIDDDGKVHVKLDGIHAVWETRGSSVVVIEEERPVSRSRAVKKLQHLDRDGEQVKVGNHYYVTALHDCVSVISLLNDGMVRVLGTEDDMHEVHANDLENPDDEDYEDDNFIGIGPHDDVELRLSDSEDGGADLEILIDGLGIKIRLEDADVGRLIKGYRIANQTAVIDEADEMF